jgi:hypothetical protein
MATTLPCAQSFSTPQTKATLPSTHLRR